jgi:putative membrane protein
MYFDNGQWIRYYAVDPGPAPDENEDENVGQTRVLAGFRPGWFVYNMFNAWAFVLAAGLSWGAFILAPAVGLDPASWVVGLLDTWGLHWAWAALAGVLVLGVVGSLGLAVAFLTEYWNFELARVPGAKGTLLRTRHGLFRTREVNRDDDRIRGVQISEPVLWRWLGIADTTVVTTGLDEWSMSAPTAVLPRGPVRVARPTAAAVLETADNPLDVPLRPHPRAALGRRVFSAVLTTALVSGVLGAAAAMGLVPWAAVWAAPALLGPLTLLGAVIAYRALGHGIADEYVVLRSGPASRATTALRRSAVSTVVIRESVFQRMLGLRSVAAMTAAGAGGYEAPDIAAEGSALFASEAAPGVLDPFLVTEDREAVLAR